jgi:2-dehydro-3-deoxyphosphogluconate aldolase/(4S)-4-hydroxy-2-oxoglutarate aldolase
MDIAPMTRLPLPRRTDDGRVIAVVRADDASAYAPIISALIAGGVVSVELTLTTPRTLEALPDLLAEFGHAADLGIGTVTTVAEAAAAIEVGAGYLVTPVTNRDIVEKAVEQGVPIIPGGLTPSELYSSWRLGAAAVKVFPAATVGPGYVSQLRGPFPDLVVIPSGGVDLKAASEWLAAGAAAVSIGGPLLGDATRGGDLAALTERARLYADTARRVKAR